VRVRTCAQFRGNIDYNPVNGIQFSAQSQRPTTTSISVVLRILCELSAQDQNNVDAYEQAKTRLCVAHPLGYHVIYYFPKQ